MKLTDTAFLTQVFILAQNKHTPLVFHDEAYGVLHLSVFGSTASLHLGLHNVSLVLDVFQRVLHQVTHSAVLRRIQRLDVLQDVQHLMQPEGRRERKDTDKKTLHVFGTASFLCFIAV